MESPPMAEMRQRLLSATPAEYGFTDADAVWAVAMDMGMPGAAATVVALADGNASLYTTGTFGVIGGYAHEQVRAAAVALCELAASCVEATVPTAETGYPDAGRIRFYLKTARELRMAEGDESVLGEGNHPLSPLFFAAHDVITGLRQVSDG